MCFKFDGGLGAINCDGCHERLLEGLQKGGDFSRVLKVVFWSSPIVVDGARDTRDFCSPACMHRYCLEASEERADLKAVLCDELARFYRKVPPRAPTIA